MQNNLVRKRNHYRLTIELPMPNGTMKWNVTITRANDRCATHSHFVVDIFRISRNWQISLCNQNRIGGWKLAVG